jgi:AraC family transcriptional regulator, regulatory protein of adaptative response / methylated-DNA-[protein]-cysteine methyltransferase
MKTLPMKSKENNILKQSYLETPLGQVIAIADEKALYLLEFMDCKGLEREIARLKEKAKSKIIQGCTEPIESIEYELKKYFEGTLIKFKTPLLLFGTPFQKRVWEELNKIPLGETRSYSEIAIALGQPTAYRAVANANASNQLAIIIPCHRVINSNGKFCGYAGGVTRKKWLISHEKKMRLDFSEKN